jgi:hypothetical protein
MRVGWDWCEEQEVSFGVGSCCCHTCNMLQPKPRRPDRLAPDMEWTAEDKTVGLVGWLTIWEAWKDPSWQAGGVVKIQTVMSLPISTYIHHSGQLS